MENLKKYISKRISENKKKGVKFPYLKTKAMTNANLIQKFMGWQHPTTNFDWNELMRIAKKIDEIYHSSDHEDYKFDICYKQIRSSILSFQYLTCEMAIVEAIKIINELKLKKWKS